jgi:tripartite-type tricarboxylate transporter receptor subunit TctC
MDLRGDREAILPDVPTAKQAGLDYEVSIWAGMFAPKGTPTNIIDKLANNLDAALEEPAVKNRLADLGVSSQKGGAFSPKIRQLCQI